MTSIIPVSKSEDCETNWLTKYCRVDDDSAVVVCTEASTLDTASLNFGTMSSLNTPE
jgi:hypothetical protein